MLLIRLIKPVLLYNNHRFEDEDAKKVNTIQNTYLLVRMVWSIVVGLLLFGIYLYLVDLDADRYGPHLMKMLPAGAVFILGGVMVYFGRVFVRSQVTPMVFDLIVAVGCLSWMAVLSGKESLFFLVTAALMPVPYWVVPSTSKGWRRFTVLTIIFIFGVQFALIFDGRFELDVPQQVYDWANISIGIFLAVVFSQIGFIGRTAEDYYLKRITDANDVIKDRDERIQHELDFAADIQKSVLKVDTNNNGYFSLYVSSLPYGKVNGDYYDVVEKDGDTFIFLADASGHGVPAAILTIVVRQAFRSALDELRNPNDILERINLVLNEAVQTYDYVTGFILRIRPGGKVDFSSAGHTKPFLLQRDRAAKVMKLTQLDTKGLILGAIEDLPHPYEMKSIQLAAGDRIVLYTDGVTEERNGAGEEAGSGRLQSWLLETFAAEHKLFHDATFQAWLDFVGGKSFSDDVTLLTIEYKG